MRSVTYSKGRRPGHGTGAVRDDDEAAALGPIDEYRARVYPVLVGGGIPFFAQGEHRVDLELVETRTFSLTSAKSRS